MKSKLSTSILLVVIGSLILSGGMMLAGVIIGKTVYVSGGDGGRGGSATIATNQNYMSEYEANQYLGIAYGGNMGSILDQLLESGALEGTYVIFKLNRKENVTEKYTEIYDGGFTYRDVLDNDGQQVTEVTAEEYRIFLKDKLDEFMQKRFAEQQASSSSSANTTGD